MTLYPRRNPSSLSPNAGSIDVFVMVDQDADTLWRCLRALLRGRDIRVSITLVYPEQTSHVVETVLQDLSPDIAGSGPHGANLSHIAVPAHQWPAAWPGNLGSPPAGEITLICRANLIVPDGFFNRLRVVMYNNPKAGVVGCIHHTGECGVTHVPQGYTAGDFADFLWQKHGHVLGPHQQTGMLPLPENAAENHAISDTCLAMRGSLARRVWTGETRLNSIHALFAHLAMGIEGQGYQASTALGLFALRLSSIHEDISPVDDMVLSHIWGRGPSFALASDCEPVISEEELPPARMFAHPSVAGQPSILYLLPSFGHYGGVISVIQVVNELIHLGCRANIAVLGRYEGGVIDYTDCHFSPWMFESDKAFLASEIQCDILVATHWSTVYPAIKFLDRGHAKRLAYFVQDYEPDFHPAGSEKALMARITYPLIKNRICKTRWLQRKLDEFGGKTDIIPLGLDLGVFRNRKASRRRQLISTARMSTPRRNWPGLTQVYHLLAKARPDIELAVYGLGLDSEQLPEGTRNYGKLNTAREVASVLNESHVLVDVSLFQGFGRPGLEAIACGTVPVLTHNGGITAYAKHGYNALLIDPHDSAETVRSIIALFDDEALYERLQTNGASTAGAFSLQKEGELTLAFMKDLLEDGNKLI